MFPVIQDATQALLYRQLQLKYLIRFSLVSYVQYRKEDELGHVVDTIIFPLRSTSRNVYMAHGQNDIGRMVRAAENELIQRNEQLLGVGSDWIVDFVSAQNVEVGKLTLLGGCSKKDVLSMLNPHRQQFITDVPSTDGDCFFNAVALALCPPAVLYMKEESRQLIVTQMVRTLNRRGISSPVNVTSVSKFVKKILTWPLMYLLWRSNMEPSSPCIVPLSLVRLLLGSAFYCCKIAEGSIITSISTISISWPNRGEENYHCFDCSASFSRRSALRYHFQECKEENNKQQTFEYPTPDTVVKFESHSKRVTQPIIGVLDFESSLRRVSREENATRFNCEACASGEEECSHQTTNIHLQEPTTYSLVLADIYGEIVFEKTESDEENLMLKFFSTLTKAQKTCKRLLQRYQIKKDYTAEEMTRFQAAQECYLCGQEFSPDPEPTFGGHTAVRDHCHYTNRYLGATHSRCNLRRRERSKIPIYVHNLQNYDSHFIFHGLEHLGDKRKLSDLPLNFEKFRTLTLNSVTFLDSMQVIPGSLAALVSSPVRLFG